MLKQVSEGLESTVENEVFWGATAFYFRSPQRCQNTGGIFTCVVHKKFSQFMHFIEKLFKELNDFNYLWPE